MNGKENSRKWKLAKWSFWTLVALLVVPGIISLVLALIGKPIVFALITGEMFITGLGLVVGLYGAANILQKKFIKLDDEGDGSGGQPEGTDNP